MKDTIYRQAAIEAICKACSMEGDYHKCDGYPETSTWCEYLVALRALPSAQPERCEDCVNFSKTRLLIPQPEPQWIPCSERLPELEEDVLTTLIHGNGDIGVVMAYRTTSFNPRDTYWKDWANEYTWENESVLAWMPLPEPYKEG